MYIDNMNDFLALILAGKQPNKLNGEVTNNFNWQWLEYGILKLTPLTNVERSLVLSCGIHGNETLPVEMVNQLLKMLFSNLITLKCRLLVIFGNIDGLRANKRYIYNDMNRMFGERWQRFPQNCERDRVALLEETVSQFFKESNENERWHLDMHTTLRESYHKSFGMMPYKPTAPWDENFLDWLSISGLEALVFHQTPSGTFSHFTCESFNVLSTTIEMGISMPLGQNNLKQFVHIQQSIEKLISGEEILFKRKSSTPAVRYKVKHQITRNRESFKLHMGFNILNFTPFSKGTLLVEDGESNYIVQSETEYVIFPNPALSLGRRAGLILIKDS